jgi:hypothetical protein
LGTVGFFFDEEDLKNYHIIHKKLSDGSKYVEMRKIGTKKKVADTMVSDSKNLRLKP